MKVSEIRERFLTYYKNNNHNIVKSSSLVPSNDETLLFTNSGMVQFKDIFLGNETRDYKRATTVQKCLRAGGKHNDLDNVGYTARHHTFFEMMGNFSFGDYFKESAIFYAWEFLTKNLELSKDKLLVTVYHSDDEAYKLWKKIAGLSDDKIIRIATADNFWEMGEFGPCGPCTEIFYDHGDHIYGGPPGSKDEDGDRFIEIWNLVFMQYEKLQNKEMIPLAKPCIDTGMGLERIASILQHKNDNYDIDLFQNIIQYSSDAYKTKINDSNRVAFKVIADHLRAISFMIADGILPSNEGRGYVLRRIIRRAIRYSYALGAKEPILYKLFPVIKQEMGEAYPELKLREDFIVNTINQEELKFVDTFENGIKILNKEIESHSTENAFSGTMAFKLYDTYGFPRDLTEDILRNHNIVLNNEEFEESFNKHRDLAKKSWKGSGEIKEDKIWNGLAEKIKATKFVGYDTLEHENKVDFLLKEKEGTLVFVENIAENEEGYAVFNETPFYAELGGQVADIGEIHTSNSVAEVLDVQKKYGNIFYHKIIVKKGEIKAKEDSKLVVDKNHRKDISRNHSAIHLLSRALNDILGNHVTQQGSMVNSKRLRLDVSYSKALTNDEIEAIETRINQMVLENHPVVIKNMTFNEAIEQGAVPLFSEKYPEIVRTVRIGDKNSIMEDFELCGGTHINSTGEIGTFKIISEGSISSGVRRIEAICGKNFLEESTSLSLQAKQLAKMLNTDQRGILSKVESLIKENLSLKKEIGNTIVKMLTASLIGKKEILSNDNCIIYQEAKNIESNKLREVATSLINTEEKLLVVLFIDSGERSSFVIGISKKLSLDMDFKAFTKKFQELTEGTGGGNNIMFQGVASGDSIKAVESIIKDSLL